MAVTDEATATPPSGEARPLDEIMLAMDVVDTLRHREHLVARELNEENREQALLVRLREIYDAQGIAVPDHILQEGVAALKENRFVYKPPPPSLSVTLAKLYVRRSTYTKIFAIAVAVLVAAFVSYQAFVVWPAEQAAEELRIELTETLPSRLQTLAASIDEVSRDPEASAEAEQLLAEGRAALGAADADGARMAVAGLERLDADLRRVYELKIVSRPGALSGVWRVPEANPSGQNYYLIVEAITADGDRLSLPITSEETGETKTVNQWGVRVSEAIFNRVGSDKSDDGIIQDDVIAVKERGVLDLDYRMPVLGGAITEW